MTGPVQAWVDHAVVSGTFSLDGETHEVDNNIWVVGDDLNNDLGCYGHPLVKSPHIDRLAAQGVRFERAYTNVPVCNPSRTSFLSGRRPGSPNRDAVYLPNYFHQNGYLTVEAGKVRHGYGASQNNADFEEHFEKPQDALTFLGRKHEATEFGNDFNLLDDRTIQHNHVRFVERRASRSRCAGNREGT